MMATMVASLIAPMTSSLIQPTASLLINCITERGHKDEFFSLLTPPLMMKVLGKIVRRAGRGYMNKNV